MRVKGRRLLRAAVVVALLPLGCGPSDSGDEDDERPPATVEIFAPTLQSFEEVARFTGALTAAESVMVRPETTGVVEEINFEEGQAVQKGDLLFVLRNGEQTARLANAEASRELAIRVYDRVKSLEGDEVLSNEELDRAQTELAQAEARLEIARIELERTNIRAPFDGVLGQRLVSPGDRVTGGGMARRGDQTGLVQIDAIDELKLIFTVPEVTSNAVTEGTPLTVEVVPFGDEKFPGAIYFVAPSLDPRNRRLQIKGLIPNAAHRLRPGLSCTVELPLGRRENVLLVPEASLVRDVAGTFVWRITADDTTERIAVVLGARRGGMVEIRSGLEAGDRIVGAGTNKVSQGRPVVAVSDEGAT